jgi:type III pantothenate kinase
MHNLVLDIGNTNIKLAIFEERRLVEYQILKQIDPDMLISLIEQYDIKNATISSVNADLEDVVDVLKKRTRYIPFSTQVNTGIDNHYHTLSTLGLDRWAKVLAAHATYPGRNCLMIDAGTCMTYDLLNSASAYFGGSISPGIHMRFSALNHFTGRLPKVDWNENEEIPAGTDTISAIKNGVLQGLVNEVEGYISAYNKENIDLTVLLTGGNGAFLLKQLKNSIFAPQIIHDPYLVLKGLNEVIAFEYVQKN